jgi:hypothetical protein
MFIIKERKPPAININRASKVLEQGVFPDDERLSKLDSSLFPGQEIFTTRYNSVNTTNACEPHQSWEHFLSLWGSKPHQGPVHFLSLSPTIARSIFVLFAVLNPTRVRYISRYFSVSNPTIAGCISCVLSRQKPIKE